MDDELIINQDSDDTSEDDNHNLMAIDNYNENRILRDSYFSFSDLYKIADKSNLDERPIDNFLVSEILPAYQDKNINFNPDTTMLSLNEINKVIQSCCAFGLGGVDPEIETVNNYIQLIDSNLQLIPNDK